MININRLQIKMVPECDTHWPSLTSSECVLLKMFASTRSEVIRTARRPSMQKGGMRNDIHDTRTKAFAMVSVLWSTSVTIFTGSMSSFMNLDNGWASPTGGFVASRKIKASLKLIICHIDSRDLPFRRTIQDWQSESLRKIFISTHSFIWHTGQIKFCFSDWQI